MHEYKLLGRDISEEEKQLVLRVPQLNEAKAALEAAKAAKKIAEVLYNAAVESAKVAETALKEARLSLERTEVKAPFDATVKERYVELGSVVSVGTPLASIVDIGEFWIRASIPVEDLKWIDIPGFNSNKASSVRIYCKTAWGEGVFREGLVKGIVPGLDPDSRMAVLIISVKDPLDIKSPDTEEGVKDTKQGTTWQNSKQDKRRKGKRYPLLLDSYVRLEIAGKTISNLVKVPRDALRDGNKVWLVGPDNRLVVREVNIVWKGRDYALVSNLQDGELLVVSDLATPVEGMSLRIANVIEDGK